MRHYKRSVGNFQIIAPDVNADDSQRMAMLTELLKIQFKTLNNQNLQRFKHGYTHSNYRSNTTSENIGTTQT